MGQTVSLPECVTGGSVVKVMRPDGGFDQFDFPCVSAEVMLKHPGHLVVYCAPVSKNSIGQRSNIIIMLPDQPLLPGQPYMLYPIPEKYKKSLARSKSFSALKKKFESASTPTVTPAEKRSGRRKALKMIFTRLNLATHVAFTVEEKGVETSPANEQSGPIESPQASAKEQEIEEKDEDKKDMTVQLPNPADLNFSWRPFLATIPESPLGFHSRPDSPLGLYKMDRGISQSPLSVGSRRLPSFVTAS